MQSAWNLTLCVFVCRNTQSADRSMLSLLTCTKRASAAAALLFRGSRYPQLVPNSPRGEVDPTDSSIDDIAWLNKALFAIPGSVISRAPRWPISAAPVTWAALPFRGTTRRLVPTTPKFAAEAFANDHDAMSNARRAAGKATRGAVRVGALHLAPRLHASADVIFGDPATSVIAAAAKGLDQTVAACAITLGPRRYNRKPVVQLMNHREGTIGFLKVGADAITSAMVATEAATVRRLQQSTAPPLVVPRVLWQAEWNGRSVACFSSVASGRDELAPADSARLVATANAIVAAGAGATDVPLRGCALINRVRQQADRVADADISRLLDLAEALFGERMVSVGQWHGDFSPWNMISSAASTALIDWEFANNDMPVGADLLHNRVMVATHLNDEPASSALRELAARGNDVPELHAAGVPADQHRPHLLLYLFELLHRDLVLQQAGQADTGFGTPARAVINTILAEADR